ncbi:hypothetical protein ACHHYP_07968 [Achlya hypogyna]|uniref:RGS domain-containing protein n=1 Tax=Achlya hypogyna TaxID=1202772 RepID=A0A1V9YPY8_ACHHY|nr:hypothetical protein ACHHYP_07968 [Achlya hypogyna]
MGSFPSATPKTAPNQADAVRPAVAKKPPDAGTMPFPTQANTVCYNYLRAMPLPRVLESPVGRRLFAAHCSDIKKEDVLYIYFALQTKWQQLKEPQNNNADDTVNLQQLEHAVRVVSSTTRLSNATVATLRIGLNAGGTFTNENDLIAMMEDAMKALKAVEWENWPRSAAGREFMAKTVKFEPLLRDEMAMCYFHQFLVQEYSSENLEFLDSVNAFEDGYDSAPGTSVDRAARILRLFVDENAPLQINIPSKIRVRLERKVMKDRDAPRDVFRAAKSEIVALVQRDSWPRYLKTPSWAGYLDFDETVARTASAQRRHDIYLEFIGDDDLDAILAHELGREYLALFLGIVVTGSEGTVDFIHHAATFANVQNDKERDELKREIYRRYLAPDAPAPARSVTPGTIAEIARQLEGSKNGQLFDKAVNQARSYLELEIIPQFKKNGMYAKYRILVGQTASEPIKRKGSFIRVIDR